MTPLDVLGPDDRSLDDVRTTAQRAAVRLGSDPVAMPEPFAGLITQLPIRRRRGVADQAPTRWLFPGARAGCHLDPSTLTSRTLAVTGGSQLRSTTRANSAAVTAPR